MLYPMPDWVYTDTLTIRAKHGRTDDSRGINPAYAATGPTIPANVAKPSVLPTEFAQQSGTTLEVTFTTNENPDIIDPSGMVRKLRDGDMVIWNLDGKEWTLVGELVPRTDPRMNAVHYWGRMRRAA